MRSSPNPRIFALIVGIDKYKSRDFDDLEGSANDARAVKEFLLDRLHVPDSHIIVLIDELATRDAIITNFEKHLICNHMIENGDLIIFYYAGHGSRIDSPSGPPSTGGKVATLVLHDGDSQNGLIYGYTIDTLLHGLAKAKGNNIVTIFDACHSGGIVRHTPSYVFLASCRQEVVVYESVSHLRLPRGVFTSNLLEVLYRVRLDQLTYYDIIERLPAQSSQLPHCGGLNKHRLVFSRKLGTNPKAFSSNECQGGTLRVQAGNIHGVDDGTEFAIQDTNAEPLTRKDIGDLVPLSVDTDSSVLRRRDGDDRFPFSERGRVLDWKNPEMILKVFIKQDFKQQLQSTLLQPDRGGHFTQVDDCSKADVILSNDSGRYIDIERVDGFIPKHSNATAQFDVGDQCPDLPNILNAVAHFNHHLLRRECDHELAPKVRMELYLLSISAEGYRVPNLAVGDLFKGGHTTKLIFDEHAEYGFSIVNDSDHDLYPYLFYFDPIDYSITSMYQALPSFPLPARQGLDSTILPIGHGPGSGQPFEFPLRPGVRSETGFIKLFVTTTHVDFDGIAQDSSFHFTCICRRKMRVAATNTTFCSSQIAVVTVFNPCGGR